MLLNKEGDIIEIKNKKGWGGDLRLMSVGNVWLQRKELEDSVIQRAGAGEHYMDQQRQSSKWNALKWRKGPQAKEGRSIQMKDYLQ